MSPSSKLQQRIAEEKARKLAENQALQEPTRVTPLAADDPYAKYIPEPDFEPDPFAHLLDDLDILKAYALWCHKMTPTVRQGQTESIMISCPMPGHEDKDPSAWVNTDKNTWYCGRCSTGGDAYDIAAIKFGFDGDYKKGRNFGKLRELMAADLGYGVKKSPGKKDVPYLKAVPDLEPEPAQNPAPPPTIGAPPVATVVAGSDRSNEDIDKELAELISLTGEAEIIFPTLDWRSVVTEGTFLHDYMLSTTVDNIAEEYHFWQGLLALGLAAGRDCYLLDSPRVYGNLFVCLLGQSGDGKSRSFRHLRSLIAEALPFDRAQEFPKGVYLSPTPSSAEVLIQHFQHEVRDINNPKMIVDYAPIRGLVEFSELADLSVKASRMGNALKPALIDFYDMKQSVSTSSVTHGTKEARQPFCSVFSSTQPESLKVILRDSDRTSGFLNRWVFASGKSKPQNFFQEDIVDISSSVDSLKKIVGWVGFGKEVQVSDDAIQLMESFFKAQLERVQRSNPLLARLSLLYKKLLLLLAINEHSTVVTAEMAEKVISMHEYSVQAYELTGQRIGADEQTDVYNAVIDAIGVLTRNGEGPTYGSLKKYLAKSNYRITHIDNALKIAERMDEVESYSKPGRGRPAQRYRFVGTA